MNIAIVGLTPTQQAARDRHAEFKRKIAEQAEKLKTSKTVGAIARFAAPVEGLPTPSVTDGLRAIREEISALLAQVDQALIYRDGTFPTIAAIQEAVAKEFGVTRREICSARRTLDIVRPRQVGYYIARELTPFSLPQIGRLFGNRDHTSVYHGAQKIVSLLPRDASLALAVASIFESLTGAPQ